jgi:hypothetical protein
MINVIPHRLGGGGESGMPGEEGITPFPTPITPVILGALVSPRLRVFENIEVEKFDRETLDSIFMDVGRAVAGPVLSAMLCTQDSPTCRANIWLSKYASFDRGLLYEDQPLVQSLIDQTHVTFTQYVKDGLELARGSEEVSSMAEDALRELKRRP